MRAGLGDVTIRLLRPEEPTADLTDLLHRAYAPLAAAGLRFYASWQDDETTQRRIAGGECYVAEAGGVLVGTITVHGPGLSKVPHPWYARPDVSTFQQYCVEPSLQRSGLGSRLLDLGESRARDLGAAELSCDTAGTAAELIAFYTKRGYRHVSDVDWQITNYSSVVLSKTLR